MTKKSLRKERDLRHDDQASHALDGSQGRKGKECREKCCDDKRPSSKNGSSALEQGQGQVRDGNPKKADNTSDLLLQPSHNVCYQGEYELKVERLQELATVVVNNQVHLTESYLDLVKFIRQEMFRPEKVREVLYASGLRKERISEITRIAGSSNEIFNDFCKRITGWKATLERIRSNRGGPEQIEFQWNQFFKQFERQAEKAPMTRPLYTGNGHCLAMWDEKELKTMPVKLIESDGWSITVRRKEA